LSIRKEGQLREGRRAKDGGRDRRRKRGIGGREGGIKGGSGGGRGKDGGREGTKEEEGGRQKEELWFHCCMLNALT
jgi:hypothetical protein